MINSFDLRQEERVSGDIGDGVGRTLRGLGSGGKDYRWIVYLLCCVSCFSGIVEVVNENVKKSRRLIIILVPETSGFSWPGNSSEEQVAMYNALIQEGIKVVLLELEKIQDYEKDFYSRSRPYALCYGSSARVPFGHIERTR